MGKGIWAFGRGLETRGIVLFAPFGLNELDEALDILLFPVQLLGCLEACAILPAVAVPHIHDFERRAGVERKDVPHTQYLAVEVHRCFHVVDE